MQFSVEHQQILLSLARSSIASALESGNRLSIQADQSPPALQHILSSFVTLHINEKLRGCIGSLEAREPLVSDVVRHAYGAAFEDPRFPPLRANELPEVKIDISVLTPQEKINCASDQELLDAIAIGCDGLTLTDGRHHATFLPSVWQQLQDKQSFLSHLKRKAGLSDKSWSPTLQAYRYRTINFAES